MSWQETFNQWSGGAANIANVVGIGIGGLWVLARFRRGRESFPRAKLQHEWTACDAPNAQILVRLGVHVTNTGAVALRLGKMFVRVQKISPCDEYALGALKEGNKLKQEGDWPIVAEKTLPALDCIIEPGEDELLEFDFLIDSEIDVVSVYTHIDNRKNKGKGWNCSTWHKTNEGTSK